MKIGILTFHRAHNYGAVLQCYALQEVLKSMGHDVYIIDYRQRFVEEVYSPLSIRRLAKFVLYYPKRILTYITTISTRLKKKKLYANFRKQYLNITDTCSKIVTQEIDCYIIGSDQLWSLDCTGGRLDNIYLGNFEHNSNSRIIGYAISTNLKSLEILKINDLGKYVYNFHKLSMREDFAADYIKKCTGLRPTVCLDPTLLTDKNIWDPLINEKWKKERYILMYEVRHMKDNPNMLLDKAKILADFYNCKIIDLSNMTHSVEDFVSLFKYAQYVVTTSFHATVFSIIFNTPFYSIKLNDGHDGRYVNLLKGLGLENCCVEKEFVCQPQEIDFLTVNEKLKNLKLDSCNFLSTL